MDLSSQYTFFYPKPLITCRGKLLDFSETKIMGIINVTPDSFFDGGKYQSDKAILKRAESLIKDGASILDIGAMSTRPNAKVIGVREEISRLIPAIKAIRKEFNEVIISADTFRATIAKQAVDSGADIVNDISGGTLDSNMFEMVGELKVPYVLMHIKGTPQNMQVNPTYKNVANDVLKFFTKQVHQLRMKGVNDIIIDPGFGFGKTTEHNYSLLNHLQDFQLFDCPILVGISRKSMISKVIDVTSKNALNGTTVLHTLALLNGANILRVHDAKAAMEAIKIVGQLKNRA
ncbi:MAG: dihydropteroate synthase [Bacteroidia bacterium]|nr:dihydropteroate synthase [Bacteroidia bacterium]